MRINVAVPEDHVSKPILDAGLEVTTKVNESLMKSGGIPPFSAAVRDGVRWRPEPPGAEHFDHALTVLSRKWGDCDDVAPYRAAELRVTGEDPGARAVVKPSGHKKWHAYVERSNAPDEDPSIEAGMLTHSSVRGATVPLLGCGPANVGAAVVFPRLAVRPIIDPRSDRIESWQARADLPWHYRWTDSPVDVAMSSLHAAPDASQAIAGACAGALVVAGLDDESRTEPLAIDYLEAMQLANEGAEYEDILSMYGEGLADAVANNVSGIFKALRKGIKRGKKVLDSKAVKAIAPLVPGGGAAYMLARGGLHAGDAAFAPGGNVFDRAARGARGFGGGAAAAAADYLEHPLVQSAAKIIPGGAHMIPAAQQAARMAEALASATPPPIAKMGLPEAGQAMLHLPQCAIAAVSGW